MELVEARSGEVGLLIEPGLTDADDIGLSGILGAGVFDLECQTPSTSIPLSRARTPNGTLGSPRPRGSVVCCMSSCGWPAVVATMVVYFRSLQWLYNSLRQPRPITLTWSLLTICFDRGRGMKFYYSKCQDLLLCSRLCQYVPLLESKNIAGGRGINARSTSSPIRPTNRRIFWTWLSGAPFSDGKVECRNYINGVVKY